VYKEFLCYHSSFFNAAFNSSFIEGQAQTMEYPDAHPYVFGIFVQWIHAQTIGINCFKVKSALRMVELWILADRLLVPALTEPGHSRPVWVQLLVSRLGDAPNGVRQHWLRKSNT
jgi:hypothetical protein